MNKRKSMLTVEESEELQLKFGKEIAAVLEQFRKDLTTMQMITVIQAIIARLHYDTFKECEQDELKKVLLKSLKDINL